MLGELVDEAQAALALPGGTGLEALVRVMGRSLATHRGYAHKLIGHSRIACVEQLRDLIGELLVQAQKAGQVSPGIELGDILTMVWGLRGVVETAGDIAPEAWQRYVDIQFAGLRCSAPAGSGPAVTWQQLRQISGGTDAGATSCT
jgi:hypothetical protein